MANLSLKDDTHDRAVSTGVIIKLDIDGATSFKPPTGTPWRDLALYANVDLPAPGTSAREALARGGWRAWFQQKDTAEADGRDETGYLGPIPFPRFGTAAALISHTWPHTVDTDAWEFCVRFYAYDSGGKAVTVPLTIGTREVKILDR
jgi:hypothetical protein